MAVVWLNSTATSSTSFNTISIWSTWDDDNNQEIPLGRLPQSGDYIYANGYTCLVPTGTLNLGNAVLSNGLNEKTGRSGGTFYFVNAGTYNITANIEHYGYSTVLGNTSVTSANRQTTIQGNITSYTTNGTYAVRCGGSNGVTTINGNLVGAYCLEAQWGTTSPGERVYINGSIENETNSPSIYFAHSGGGAPVDVVSVNGNVKNEFVAFLSNTGRADLTINGIYTKDIDFTFNKTTLNLTCQSLVNNGNVIKCNNLTVYNSIIYKGYNNYAGVTYVNLYTPNPDTFIWKDISEPRSNPFIILTNAELANRQQYPAVTDVKKDVPYAYGLLEGTFEPNYPPESVVLKDYVYDGGEMVGTLDLPQAPTTSDIVTAIKNDSDLGGKINATNTNVGNMSTAVTTIDGKVDIIDTNVDTLLSRITSVLTQRLGQSVTVEILQQILVAHLNN